MANRDRSFRLSSIVRVVARLSVVQVGLGLLLAVGAAHGQAAAPQPQTSAPGAQQAQKTEQHPTGAAAGSPLEQRAEALNVLAVGLEAEIKRNSRYVLSLAALHDADEIARQAHQLQAAAK